MSLILNIETATEICSVALAYEGEMLALEEADQSQAHSKLITLLIRKAFDKTGNSMSDLAAVAVSSGPGSYTGLRIGVSTAKGICYALNKPLIAIDTLEALAWGAARAVGMKEAIYCPMIDARRMEVYTACFSGGRRITEDQSIIIKESEFGKKFDQSKQLVFSGNGAAKCQPLLSQMNAIFLNMGCSAEFLVDLSHKCLKKSIFCDLVNFQPSYLKEPNITKGKKKL